MVLTACTGCDPPPGEVTRGRPGLAQPVWAILVDSICTPHRLFIPPPAQSSFRIWGCIWGDTPDRTPYSPVLFSPPHFSFLGGPVLPQIGVHDDQFPGFLRASPSQLKNSWRTPLERLLISAVPSGHTRVARPPGSVVASSVPSLCRVPSRSNVPCCAPPRARRAPTVHVCSPHACKVVPLIRVVCECIVRDNSKCLRQRENAIDALSVSDRPIRPV